MSLRPHIHADCTHFRVTSKSTLRYMAVLVLGFTRGSRTGNVPTLGKNRP